MTDNYYHKLISGSHETDQARQRQPTEYEIEQRLQLEIQKKWIWIHSVVLLLVSMITIPLLHSKSNVLSQFYNHNQCCYCLWVSENSTVSEDYEIEWSVCKNKHDYSVHLDETCSIDGQNACQTNSNSLTGIQYNELSYRSSFFFYVFDKYYPYYGIYTLALVILYMSLLLITTYYFKTLIYKQLFICNLALTISVYYCYIKLYQYSMHNYHTNCPNPPSNVQQICYRSAFSKGLDAMFSMLVYATTIYTAYCVYVVYPCCLFILTRCLSKYDICVKFGKILSLVLVYGAVIGGSVFVIISYVILMWMAVSVDNNFGEGLIKNISAKWEEVFIIFIGNVLLILAFDMFFLRSCKQDLIEMFCKRQTQANENDEDDVNGNQHMMPIQD